jgi:hypothetical protein
MKCFKSLGLAGLGLVAVLFASMGSAQEEEIFNSGFELPVGTPVTHGTVELRAPDGTVRTRLPTDAKGQFPKISTSLVQPGDKLVAFGGFWRNRPFAGEMIKLMPASDSFQIVNPVTSLVTRLAESSQVSGSTARQRIDEAVGKLSALYMVGDDWFQPNPKWIGRGLDSACPDELLTERQDLVRRRPGHPRVRRTVGSIADQFMTKSCVGGAELLSAYLEVWSDVHRLLDLSGNLSTRWKKRLRKTYL